jgi:hypothetical protein
MNAGARLGQLLSASGGLEEIYLPGSGIVGKFVQQACPSRDPR